MVRPLGYAVRGLVFLILALLLGRSALHHNAAEAGGLEQALDFFSPALRRWVAGGLCLFGAMSLIEARLRRIHRSATVDDVARKVVDKVRG